MRRVLDRDRSSNEELLQSKLIDSLSRIDDSMFITLEGSYNVWQEVSCTARQQQHQPLSFITTRDVLCTGVFACGGQLLAGELGAEHVHCGRAGGLPHCDGVRYERPAETVRSSPRESTEFRQLRAGML